MNFTRTNEGGSVVTFAIVAVVLAVLVIGGVYTLQNSNQPTPKKSSEVATSSSPSVSPSKSTSVAPSQSPSKAPSTPKPSTSPAPAKNIPTTGMTALPTTGPEDNIVQAFMLASLVGVAVAYAQSYRARLVFSSTVNR